ncbi:MAG TPA: histidine--tRNA ligase [Sphaerochaeta sp.]|nr:MAG: histidine--tRNA ligase [Spirochaetes bacterium GWC2_52_13]HCS36808.1 histidine--tRNA ligase [Sphaerochaeta sp.]
MQQELFRMIQPKVLKGFRDSVPSQEIIKKQVISTLERDFSLHGFVPIDTPVLEYTEVLLGKGGGETDKQIFHFADNGGRDVALRFDLTVPFARFMAGHLNELALPFKRFHIAKVWRGENPQKGRFREFFQCDFDIVGIDSAYADVEILTMMHSALSSLGLRRFSIRVAHRGLFNAFLSHIGCLQQSVEILRTVDKLRKIGAAEVESQLQEITKSPTAASAILSYINAESSDDPLETLSVLSALAGDEQEHTQRMRTIFSTLGQLGIAGRFSIDPSITRGLDYYTGVVYETFLDDLPEIGSICSGGRYNDLASLYTKEHLPGVGSSIGLDRLLAALEELDSPLIQDVASSDVIILNQNENHRYHYHRFAAQLRESGVRCDVYLADKKQVAQFKYAEQNRIPYAILFNEEDVLRGTCTLRHLATRNDMPALTLSQVVENIERNR